MHAHTSELKLNNLTNGLNKKTSTNQTQILIQY